MTDPYPSYQDANADIGRVMDEIDAIEGVVGIELTDIDHKYGGGGVPWSDIELSLSVRKVEVDDDD